MLKPAPIKQFASIANRTISPGTVPRAYVRNAARSTPKGTAERKTPTVRYAVCGVSTRRTTVPIEALWVACRNLKEFSREADLTRPNSRGGKEEAKLPEEEEERREDPKQIQGQNRVLRQWIRTSSQKAPSPVSAPENKSETSLKFGELTTYK